MGRYDEGDFWSPPVDRKEVVRDQLRRRGISEGGGDSPRAEPEAPPKRVVDRLAELAERDGFIAAGGVYPISQTRAGQIHYRPAPPPRPEKAENPVSDEDAEAASLEAM